MKMINQQKALTFTRLRFKLKYVTSNEHKAMTSLLYDAKWNSRLKSKQVCTDETLSFTAVTTLSAKFSFPSKA